MSESTAGAVFDCRPNLLVGELGASLRYYSAVLGFAVGWRWSDLRGRFLREDEVIEEGEAGTALVVRDRAQILLTQRSGPRGAWLHLDVHSSAQVDGLFQEWRQRGADIAQSPIRQPWGMYEMRVNDPDGYVLRVSAPLPSDPSSCGDGSGGSDAVASRADVSVE